jgi:hypothetical protein
MVVVFRVVDDRLSAIISARHPSPLTRINRVVEIAEG